MEHINLTPPKEVRNATDAILARIAFSTNSNNWLKMHGYPMRRKMCGPRNARNRLMHVRNNQGVRTMINALIQNAPSKDTDKGNSFWEKAEAALFQGYVAYLRQLQEE